MMPPALSRQLPPRTLAPRALLFVAVVIWGWTFVATKVLVTEIGPVEILTLRLAIGLPFLALVLLLKRVPLRFDQADLGPLVLGGAILTVHFLVQIAGIVSTTATNTAWIVAVSPLALAVLSFVALRERIGWNGVTGIGVATLGLLLLVSRGRLTHLGWLRHTGDWLVLASAHTWALYTVATRDLSRRRNPLAVTFALLAVAGIFTGICFAATADLAGVRALSPRGMAALLYLGIPGLALGQWFWQEGVARLGAARAGLYLYLEPLATMTLAVPLLGEPFGPFVALGGGLVLAGVYLGQHARRENAVEVLASAIEGLGLHAARPFRAGERLHEINVVRQITPDSPLRPELGERWDHCDYPDGKVVLIGFPSRHLNHSCDPNAYMVYQGDREFVVARRDIAPGEEITCDYNVNITNGTAWPCHCGAARCRGTTTGDFFLLPAEVQREYRPLLAPWFIRRYGDRLEA